MNLANNLSLIRILLVPVFIGLLLYYSAENIWMKFLPAAVFLIACLTDALDGLVARKLNQRTVVGSYIDPIADKLLLLGGFLSLSFMTHLPQDMRIPAWVTIPVVTRDVIILIGVTVIFLITGKMKAEPLFISKVTTVIQMSALFAALVAAPSWLQLVLCILTVLLTIFSGIEYLKMGTRLLQ